MPMIEINHPDLLMRARHNIANIVKAERRDELFALRMHSLGWIAALHAEGLISEAVGGQLAVELDATAAARRAELLGAER